MRLSSAAAALGTLGLITPAAVAQVVSYSGTSGLNFFTGTRTEKPAVQTGPPTGPYQSYGSKITLTGANSSTTAVTTSSGTMTTAANFTTTTSSTPKNTQPCNNYVEFCTRKYSNVTNVGCHNSPFVRPGNSGSNQEVDVTTQLDDGVRFLQAQIQWPANASTPHFCHTSCDLLDAGPIYRWLGQVANWIDAHPYDVVTILLGNGNYSDPSLYVPFIEQSGITKYVYNAPYLPMALNDWPTLEDMIVQGKRVVMFLDYQANQTKYPWLLDEFSQVWETPFNPLDQSFPCTLQRPPDLSREAAADRLYIMNHNLNVKFDVFGVELLVPAVSLLNETNAAEGAGSVGLAANNCRSDWGRAPNVLNVDYYNYGSPEPCSVFAAAAAVNNVTYDYSKPCGQRSIGSHLVAQSVWVSVSTIAVAGLWLL
ncbi:PLC-like phosphodiesterase, TIM beta/alpha-barrel domain protein [Metarhizium rileyi]|uniref:PLC-like phosphodiesterase, TIM beta/alpha-barrel domain protein n=1 Tax=Metarhizium rileyi (strain RCEF 4871) TaxID=1649241 RepID=A0A167G2B0_METRR|nr:PLC-like phosphodiesterase, TIM beta/alpha-barrel domain protein [Metarhizium rileyi RCEF 4871]